MIILDVSIVNVALPDIRDALKFESNSDLQWVVTAYAIAFGGLLLLGGRIGDYFGRKFAFNAGIIVFTGASLIGGFANTQTLLIAGRALQGLGAAVLSPATLTILTGIYIYTYYIICILYIYIYVYLYALYIYSDIYKSRRKS